MGGEILVKRGSESEIDRGNAAAKCNKISEAGGAEDAPAHCAGVMPPSER